MSIEISVLIALVGCFVGLAGWLSGREKKIFNDAEWRGEVNTKLDATVSGISCIGADIQRIKDKQEEHGKKIVEIEDSAKSAHKRLDEHMSRSRRAST